MFPSMIPCADGSFYIPSALYAKAQRGIGNSGSTSPFFQGKRFPVDSNEPCGSPVLGLLFRCCPPAVIGGIIAFVVDSVERVTRWTLAHVFQEVLKRLPPLANRYSPTPVARIPIAFGMVASGSHPGPRSVGSCLCHAVRNSAVFLQTTAGFCYAMHKPSRGNFHRVSAGALAFPLARLIFASNELKNRESPEYKPGEIPASSRGSLAFSASAGRSNPADDVSGRVSSFGSAITAAEPRGLSGCRICNPSYGRESAKSTASNVLESHYVRPCEVWTERHCSTRNHAEMKG